MNSNNIPAYCQNYPNLASSRLGATIIEVTDDFFAAAERMLHNSAPTFDPDKYDNHGKYMDGWESKRRRHGGHDWAVVRLGCRASLKGVNISTKWFTGNFPKSARLEAGVLPKNGAIEQVQWTEILASQDLRGDDDNYFALENNSQEFNVVRLHIYPDGGVARLRLYGAPSQAELDTSKLFEASSIMLGARIVEFNNAHYGTVHNLIAPDKAINMGDGWETRRRRVPGFDWIVIQLARPCHIKRIEVDTAFYKGNFPDKCSLNAGDAVGLADSAVVTASMFWDEVLSPQKLTADNVHIFDNIQCPKLVSHVRLNIFPDGGIARLKIFGVV